MANGSAQIGRVANRIEQFNVSGGERRFENTAHNDYLDIVENSGMLTLTGSKVNEMLVHDGRRRSRVGTAGAIAVPGSVTMIFSSFQFCGRG